MVNLPVLEVNGTITGTWTIQLADLGVSIKNNFFFFFFLRLENSGNFHVLN